MAAERAGRNMIKFLKMKIMWAKLADSNFRVDNRQNLIINL